MRYMLIFLLEAPPKKSSKPQVLNIIDLPDHPHSEKNHGNYS